MFLVNKPTGAAKSRACPLGKDSLCTEKDQEIIYFKGKGNIVSLEKSILILILKLDAK